MIFVYAAERYLHKDYRNYMLLKLIFFSYSADETDYIEQVCGILDNYDDLFSFPSAVDVHFLNIHEGTFFNKVSENRKYMNTKVC